MGASSGHFVKYPRTPHLFGSRGTEDDRHLNERASVRFLADESLIIEEKLDGTNVGIHFDEKGEMKLQCRGHLICEGMHPQYDLFKQWAQVKRATLEEILGSQYILFGEWLYAKHSIHYRALAHYLFEFDIYDKEKEEFLDLESRSELLDGTGIETVPVVWRGTLKPTQLTDLIQESQFDAEFDNPLTQRTDNLMEGIYLRTERDGVVTGRAKFVRPEFVEKVKQSEHWQQQKMIPNLLADGVDLWK